MQKAILIIICFILLASKIEANTKSETIIKDNSNDPIDTREIQQSAKQSSIDWIQEYTKKPIKPEDRKSTLKKASKIQIFNIFGYPVYISFNRNKTENTKHSRFMEAIEEGHTLKKRLND